MVKKICSRCKKKKSNNQFSKDKNSKDGLLRWCKDCMKIYSKLHHKKYPYKRIYRNINNRCNNPKSKNFNQYGGKGIKNYLTPKNIKFLWNRDKAWLLKQPSIDRKNNNGNYTLSNCRFIEKSLNSKKDKYKPILQYDLKGNFIKEWDSIKKVSNVLNIKRNAICNCLREKTKTSGNYKWRYKDVSN